MPDIRKINQTINELNYEFEIVDKLLSKPNSQIALFGAGLFGESAYWYLKGQGYKISTIIDNSIQKQGNFIDGIAIAKFEESLLKKIDIALITPKNPRIDLSIRNQLGSSIKIMHFDTWFVIKNITKYKYLRNIIFQDEKSKKSIDGLLLTMLTQDEKYCAEIMNPNQYFCFPQFSWMLNEVFIDAGAYVGDTVEKFIWASSGNFKKIYAFEPGKQQFNAMNERKKRLISEWALNDDSILLVNAGLGDINGEIAIKINEGNLLQSLRIDSNDNHDNINKIHIYSLDYYLKDVPISFIKADIEGMEMAMLDGARVLISENKPKIAICTYHANSNLFDFVELLNNLVPEYKFALRHHSPTLMETVLYCWVD